jgi:hypothetical protein
MRHSGFWTTTRGAFALACIAGMVACGGDVTLEGDDVTTGGRAEDARSGNRPGNGGNGGNDDIRGEENDVPAVATDLGTEPVDVAVDTTDTATEPLPDTTPVPTDTGVTPLPDTREDPFNCGEISGAAEPVPAAIDLTFVIDTSGSMDEEIAQIEANLNELTTFITTSGLDIQVIMFGQADRICPPAPLTDGSCPPTDSDTYKVVNVVVNSNDSLELLRDNYSSGANYSTLFREGSIRHVVFVTDDEAEGVTASRYRTWAETLPAPGMLFDMFYHAIVSLTSRRVCDPIFGLICNNEGCDGAYGAAEAEGAEYRTLVRISGGVESSICDADWSAILDGIADRIVETSQVPCTYGLPESSRPGEVIDPTSIRVEYTEGGVTRSILEVATAEDCGAGGWYYEDPAVPETIRLCPASCTEATEAIRVIGACRKQ